MMASKWMHLLGTVLTPMESLTQSQFCMNVYADQVYAFHLCIHEESPFGFCVVHGTLGTY